MNAEEQKYYHAYKETKDVLDSECPKLTRNCSHCNFCRNDGKQKFERRYCVAVSKSRGGR